VTWFYPPYYSDRGMVSHLAGTAPAPRPLFAWLMEAGGPLRFGPIRWRGKFTSEGRVSVYFPEYPVTARPFWVGSVLISPTPLVRDGEIMDLYHPAHLQAGLSFVLTITVVLGGPIRMPENIA